jgi:tetratricopeptide (TPR) repeat protein
VSLADKINQCGFELKLEQAQRLRKAGEYDKAQVAYEEAIRLRESERARVEALMGEMNTEQKYGALIRAGSTLLERKQWTKAKDAFDEAGELYAEPPPEAVAGRRDAMYGQNLQLGTEAMDDGDMTLARSYFRLAQKQKDTQEVRDLLEKVEQSE